MKKYASIAVSVGALIPLKIVILGRKCSFERTLY